MTRSVTNGRGFAPSPFALRRARAATGTGRRVRGENSKVFPRSRTSGFIQKLAQLGSAKEEKKPQKNFSMRSSQAALTNHDTGSDHSRLELWHSL
jgi:hypothetical protein